MSDSDVKAAGTVANGGSGNSERLALMRKRLTLANSAYSNSREDELDDLKFKAATPDTPQWQWPNDVLTARGAVQGQTINARPSLVMNKLPQHVFQITNDQRQNRPAGKVIPVDDGADIEVAEILNGIVRHIEYISDADVAYDTACDQQVTFGEGYLRLLTDYIDEKSFEQDIKIGRIKNAFSVYIDPMIQDPCGSDAMWCFITENITKEEYEHLWPDAMPISSLADCGVGDENMAMWMDDETVRIAEYFYIEEEEATLNLWPGATEAVYSDSPENAAWKAMYATLNIKPKSRKTTKRKVMWCKTNGYEYLDEKEWPGKWIPVVRVVGNEVEIDGQLHIWGIVRPAKDAQRMFNYWVSQEAEMLALAPKAPFIGYGGQFEGYEDKWKTANINNWPYLEVNPDATDQEGRPFPIPQRAQPPMASSGILQAKMGAADDIKGTTGQYDPSLGSNPKSQSGVALRQEKAKTDIGTYHYGDNYSRAVRYLTRQIVDLIPKIYDTQRIARIVGIDGEVKQVKLDPSQDVPVKKIRDESGAVIETIYNPGLGTYDVMATSGPSYMTKRQETAAAMVEMAQGASDPTVALLMRYFAVKNFDFPEAQDFADAVKKLLPPGLLDKDNDESPEMAQAKQVIEELQQQAQQMQGIIESFPTIIENQRLKNEHFEADIKAFDAETKRLSALAPALGPEDVQMLVMQTMQDLLSQPSLEQEEPVSLEMGEQHMQNAPMMPQQPDTGVPQ